MIDHVLGRPSVKFRKIQVLAVVTFWSLYFVKGNHHGPRPVRKLSRALSTIITPWQTLVVTLLYLYIARNLAKLLNLESPEPLANLYTRSYFRATWVITALDAGFWTAMRIRRKWLRDLASIVFSFYYLIAAEQADEKVRKVRSMVTVEHLRVSWNKGTTPYLKFLSDLVRPRLMKYPPRAIRIARPPNSDYKEPVNGWLYFDGPLSALKKHTNIVLDIPGGGFVAMNPRTNDDKLYGWAGKTGYPVLSLDYRKAPEYPYPYALNECFDVYSTIMASRGRCVGLSGEVAPRVVITGDSAGGNLATGLVILIIEAGSTITRQNPGQTALAIPDGLVLIYPGLDMNIGNWMTDDQMALIKDRRTRKTNRDIIRRKSMQYTFAAGTPHQSEDEEESPSKIPPVPHSAEIPQIEALTSASVPEFSLAAPAQLSPSTSRSKECRESSSHHPEPLQTRLAMSSMISYFNDRVLTPEMMRAMIILYIGPHNRPDFSQDYLLSPILAPDSVLCQFPRTYFLTGERDPLVDDTVIFAGRLRRAKAALYRAEQGASQRFREEFDDRDVVEVALIPGISHGFLQFAGCFPEGWKYIYKCAKWIDHIFTEAEFRARAAALNTPGSSYATSMADLTVRQDKARRESSGEEDAGLEMSISRNSKGSVRDRAAERRKKEKLLREEMEARRRNKPSLGDRQKSMISLASEDGLLGRRMLGLAGPLTGRVEDED